MKRILLLLCLGSLCLGLTYLHLEKRVTKYVLPKGELKWSTKRPKNAKMCIPAAFTDKRGRVIGSYRINGKSYKTNNRRKVSLKGGTFYIGPNWKSDNGFQQLTLVYNSRPSKFRDNERCFRRALCKTKNETFILESNYPMTMSSFAYHCSRRCEYAVYLDMGEYGYGYIKKNHILRPLYILGFFTKHKQTNWIYIE